MARSQISRRTVLRGATALGALVAASPRLSAQQAPARSAKGPAAPLPPRGEFIIRDATVLTMDPKIDDLATGSVLRPERRDRRGRLEDRVRPARRSSTAAA